MDTMRGTAVLITLLVSTHTIAVESLPDPTRPPQFQMAPVVQALPVELVNWKVTAIRISASDRSAIINGAIVRTGDMLGSATIREILPDQVVLDHDNKQVTVRLFNQIIHKKSVTTEIETGSET